MADLRIVDAPEIPTENITGEEKLPTGGSGNYSISLDSLADYTKTKKDLADNTAVDTKVNGVRQELDAHIEDLLNPHQVTKGQIGLGNVDNTADADKPVSNSTQAAIISAVAPKADKTYVDNQLTLKANKADVYTKSETYTKQESSDLVNNSISTALTPVNSSLDLAKRGVINRYDSSLIYNSGERVVLTNGDIVRSTVDGNTNDPNVDMTGWELPQARDVFDESGKNQQQVNNTIQSSKRLEAGTITYSSSQTLSNNQYDYKYGNQINTTIPVPFTLGSNAILKDANISSTGSTTVFSVSSNSENSTINGLRLTNTGISIHYNSTGIKNHRITNSAINSTGYAVLTNGNGTVDGLIITDNFLKGNDGVELNAIRNDHRNIAVVGNVIESNSDTGGINSGFAIGMAGPKSVSVVGNTIPYSRQEAVHIESIQKAISVVGNTTIGCNGDFIRLLNDAETGSINGGVTVIGNNAHSITSDKSTGIGAVLVNDVRSSIQNTALVGNLFEGFNTGVQLGRHSTIVDSNVIVNSAVGVNLSKSGKLVGSNMMTNVDKIYRGTTATIVGDTISNGQPAEKWFDVSTRSAGLGFCHSGKLICISATASLSAGGSTNVVLFDNPIFAKGRLIFKFFQSGTNHHKYYSANFTHTDDGVAAELTDTFTSGAERFVIDTEVGIRVVDDKLVISVFSENAVSIVYDVIFEGEIYI